MENKIMCPICHHQANHKIYTCEWGIEEEYTDCEVCGFRQEFAYGNELEVIGNKCFIWDYRLVGNERTRLMEKVLKAEFMARRNWKKFKKRTLYKGFPCMIKGEQNE